MTIAFKNYDAEHAIYILCNSPLSIKCLHTLHIIYLIVFIFHSLCLSPYHKYPLILILPLYCICYFLYMKQDGKYRIFLVNSKQSRDEDPTAMLNRSAKELTVTSVSNTLSPTTQQGGLWWPMHPLHSQRQAYNVLLNMLQMKTWQRQRYVSMHLSVICLSIPLILSLSRYMCH